MTQMSHYTDCSIREYFLPNMLANLTYLPTTLIMRMLAIASMFDIDHNYYVNVNFPQPRAKLCLLKSDKSAWPHK